jgi:hypothetical protein
LADEVWYKNDEVKKPLSFWKELKCEAFGTPMELLDLDLS